FNDPGVNRLFAAVCAAEEVKWPVSDPGPTELTARDPLIPGQRVRYLAEIAQSGRDVNARVAQQAQAASRAYGIYQSLIALKDASLPQPLERCPEPALADASVDPTLRALRTSYNTALDEVGVEGVAELKRWPARVEAATAETYSYKV